MSALTIFSDKEASEPQWHSTDPEAIQQQLNARGVRFERWEADRDLGQDPAADTVINAPTSTPSTSWWQKKATRAGT